MAERKSILVIEDDPHVSAFIQRLLTASGFETRTAADAVAAAERVAERQPDLLLVDLLLGEANGWEVARALACGAPYVMMTGADVDAEARRDAQLLGAAAVVHKPFDARELLSLIERLLQSGR